MPGLAEANLAKLGITLATPAAPAANYVTVNITGNQAHISGQLPKDADGKLVVGQLGAPLTVEEGQKAARLCGIALLSQMKAAAGGDLDRIKKVVAVTCYVNSASTFTEQPAVANGCSDVLVAVLGEEVGRHSRCAVGVAQLPFGVAVEIGAQVELA